MNTLQSTILVQTTSNLDHVSMTNKTQQSSNFVKIITEMAEWRPFWIFAHVDHISLWTLYNLQSTSNLDVVCLAIKTHMSSNFIKKTYPRWLNDVSQIFLWTLYSPQLFVRSSSNSVILFMTIKPRTISNFIKIEPKVSDPEPSWTGSPPSGVEAWRLV